VFIPLEQQDNDRPQLSDYQLGRNIKSSGKEFLGNVTVKVTSGIGFADGNDAGWDNSDTSTVYVASSVPYAGIDDFELRVPAQREKTFHI